MRRTLVVVGLVAAGVVGLARDSVIACGEKYLHIAFARSQRVSRAAHPASILLFRPAKTAKSLAIQDPQFVSILEQAGHKVDVLDDPSLLGTKLAAHRYDIVLADFADAIAFEPQVRQAAASPALVPVLYQRSQAETAAAEKQFVCLLKVPVRTSQFLSVLDDLMRARADGAERIALGRK